MTGPDPFLWNFHTAIVEGVRKPGSLEDRRFLALALCGEVGELANVIKKEWRGDADPEFERKIDDELGDVYAYLQLLAVAYGRDLDEIINRVTLPKIRQRWGAPSAGGGKLREAPEDTEEQKRKWEREAPLRERALRDALDEKKRVDAAPPSADDVERARDLTRRIIAWPDDPSSGHDGIKVHGAVVNERALLIAAALAAARAQGIAQGRAEMREEAAQ